MNNKRKEILIKKIKKDKQINSNIYHGFKGALKASATW